MSLVFLLDHPILIQNKKQKKQNLPSNNFNASSILPRLPRAIANSNKTINSSPVGPPSILEEKDEWRNIKKILFLQKRELLFYIAIVEMDNVPLYSRLCDTQKRQNSNKILKKLKIKTITLKYYIIIPDDSVEKLFHLFHNIATEKSRFFTWCCWQRQRVHVRQRNSKQEKKDYKNLNGFQAMEL